MDSLNVLVVDDDLTSLQILEVIMSSLGHRVTACHDGREVLDLILTQGRPFDLLIMDVVMPEVDGLTVTARLRENETTRDMTIVCTSASANASARQAAMLVGCDFYLTKPFRRSELLEAVHSTLARKGRGAQTP